MKITGVSGLTTDQVVVTLPILVSDVVQPRIVQSEVCLSTVRDVSDCVRNFSDLHNNKKHEHVSRENGV